MPEVLDIAVLVGSLRSGSFTRRLAQALAGIASPSMKLEVVPLVDLAMYNPDLEASPPASWQEFRGRIARAHAVLFATPEYNRSVPGVLKNAIDIGSRPYGRSAWNGKPAAVISTSPGLIGGFGANHHLRQSLVFLNMPTLQQPEAYISGVDKTVAENGSFLNESARDFCLQFLASFEQWIRKQSLPGT
jgi:chromate reductase